MHSLGPRDALASLAAAVLHRRRTVYTNLGLPWREWWQQQPDRWAHDRVVRHVDVYGCTSRHAVALLATDYGREGELMTPGVDLDQFRPAPARAPVPTLLFSGALDERRKGVPTILEALPLIAAEEGGVRLWLSGPGDAASLLREAPEAARRTEVLPLGVPSAQAERYGCAWVTLLPSTFDSFGMSLLESLACGTPIVASTHAAPQGARQPRGGRPVRARGRAFARTRLSGGVETGARSRHCRSLPGCRRAL